ncbi:MAG: hypothetical protein H0T56_02490 [Pseudaminobacter sp.]|nr:hypothetical protein [Pseudaminobacter sp.]
MTSIIAKETSDWYHLLRQVLADLLTAFPKERQSRLTLYDDLLNTIRNIHFDYIRFFQNFIDETISSKRSLSLAKRNFLKARTVHSDQRSLTKHDAANYLSLTDDVSELRFLSAVIWYFHYSTDPNHAPSSQTMADVEMVMAKTDDRGGGGAWDSASVRFWYEVERVSDREEARRLAEQIMQAINQRFLMILQAYTELEGFWRRGRRPFETMVTKGLMKPGQHPLT